MNIKELVDAWELNGMPKESKYIRIVGPGFDTNFDYADELCETHGDLRVSNWAIAGKNGLLIETLDKFGE